MAKVYDLPTRIFHWTFAAGIVSALVITKFSDDESALFPYHMLIGLTLVAAVILRLLWGIFGSRFARFSSLELSPSALLTYFKDMVSNITERRIGRNPASSWAAVIMFALMLGLGTTGYLMASHQGSRTIKEVHELLANGFMIIVISHLAGLLIHSLKHKDGLGLSMVTGNKSGFTAGEGIGSARPLAGMIFLALILSAGTYVFSGYAAPQKTLSLFGTQLQLGEDEKHEGGKEGEEEEEGEEEWAKGGTTNPLLAPAAKENETKEDEAREHAPIKGSVTSNGNRLSMREKDDDDK